MKRTRATTSRSRAACANGDVVRSSITDAWSAPYATDSRSRAFNQTRVVQSGGESEDGDEPQGASYGLAAFTAASALRLEPYGTRER